MSTEDLISGIGEETERFEDARMVRGNAEFVDDMKEPGMVHVAFLRSQFAHAKINGINTADAEDVDGVLDVITNEDLKADGVKPGFLRIYGPPGPGHDIPSESLGRRLLADEKVRYQGDLIAAVIAEDRYTAHNAVDRIDVDYERLDPVVEVSEATSEEAPTLHEEIPDNSPFTYEYSSTTDEEIEKIFENAAHIVSIDKGNQRLVQSPLEPRVSLASFDASTGDLSVKTNTQVPHEVRKEISEVLDYPENKIQVVAPDVGGGFGSKAYPYPEEVLVPWFAKQFDRPVKWQATRSECISSDAPGRGVEAIGELAIDEDGNILGFRMDGHYDLGAYISSYSPPLVALIPQLMTGQYDVPEISSTITAVLTNTTPVDAYRGVTEVESIMMLERLVEMAARKAGIDPAELRRRNLLTPDQFPYETAGGAFYSSGNYPKAFDLALDTVEYEKLREKQEEYREEDRYLGIGISSFVEIGGWGPSSICGAIGFDVAVWEVSKIQIHSSGEATVFLGTSNHGQGHETSLRQVASEQLGLPINKIEIVESDTDRVGEGVGTYASRSAVMGGTAITQSSEKVMDKMTRIAAHHLEAAEEDIEYEGGEFSIAGAPERSITFEEVAEHAHLGQNIPADMEPGLEATSYYDPENFTWTFGDHIAVVEVDPDTGEIEFEDFVIVEDCGERINPMIVEGQVHGGTAQGIGQALYEGQEYDENGNLLTGSFQDYAIPKSIHVPDMRTDHTVTPSPLNPLGAKGIGESGAIAAPPAVVNAVEDALSPFDIEPMTPPLTGETIWRAVEEAREGGS